MLMNKWKSGSVPISSVHHILERLQVKTRTQAVAKAIDLKLIASRLVLLLCANAALALQMMEFLVGDCGCMT